MMSHKKKSVYVCGDAGKTVLSDTTQGGRCTSSSKRRCLMAPANRHYHNIVFYRLLR
jgi:hypothetical protein